MTLDECEIVLAAGDRADHGCEGCAASVLRPILVALPNAPWDAAQAGAVELLVQWEVEDAMRQDYVLSVEEIAGKCAEFVDHLTRVLDRARKP